MLVTLFADAAGGRLGLSGEQWRVVKTVIAIPLVWGLLTYARSRDEKRGSPVAKRLFGTATPEALAAIRIWVVALLILMVLREDLPGTAQLPASMLDVSHKSFLSLLTPLPAYRAFLASAPALMAFRGLLVGVLACALVGYKSRVTLPAATVGYIVYGGILRQYTHFFHQGLLPLFLIAVLASTPCADAWSIDRRLREKRGEAVPPLGVATALYGQSRWAVYAMMGLAYCSSGLAKLHIGGPLWWAPMNQRTKLLAYAIEARMGLSVSLWIGHLPDWFFAAIGLAAMLFEIGMISILWSRRARLVFAPILLGFHVGVIFTYQILFPDLILLPLILCQPQHVFRAVRALFGGPGRARDHLRAVLLDSGFSRPAEAPAEPSSKAGDAPLTGRTHPRIYALAAYVPVMVFMFQSYPISSLPMLSNRVKTPELTYIVVQQRLADGSVLPMDPADDIAVMHDSRHFDAIASHFEEADAASKARLDEFFTAVVKIHNARVPASQRIVSVIVERRGWNWGEHIDDLSKSTVLQSYRLDLE